MTTATIDHIPSALYDHREKRGRRWWPEMTTKDARRVEQLSRIETLVDEVENENLRNGSEAKVSPHLVRLAHRLGAKVNPDATLDGSQLHEALMDFAEVVSPTAPEEGGEEVGPVSVRDEPRPARWHRSEVPMEVAVDIRRLSRAGHTRVELSRRYSLSKSTITNIVHNRICVEEMAS